MKTVYIETSVISYFTSRISRDIVIAGHQASTKDFWKQLNHKFSPVISALVVKEISCGDIDISQARKNSIQGFRVIDITNEAEQLSTLLLSKNAIPNEYPEDALHIAIAATGNIDFIVTWNFKHINNPFTKNKILKIVEAAGYTCPMLTSPEELLGGE